MSVPVNNRIVFGEAEELMEGRKRSQLKSKLGQGIYISEIHETQDGDFVINFGNSTPKDVSDSRDKDRVLQFIDVEDIYSVTASKQDGNYVLELPSREELHRGYIERRKQILDQLDYTTATLIYENIFEFSSVENQMTPIIEIVKWTQEDGSKPITEIEAQQNSDKTRLYISTLSDLGFLNVTDGTIYPGEKMQSADLHPADRTKEDYQKELIGQVIKDGYYVLRDKLSMSMLDQYPQLCNSYYYTALQRNDPNLELDIDRIQDNYREQYNKKKGRNKINDKMDRLARADVVHKDGEYVSSKQTMWNDLVSESATASI